MTIDIYLDVDGVLLDYQRQPTHHVDSFVECVLAHAPQSTFWLTTHCRGDAALTLSHVGRLFGAGTIERLRRLRPTNWDVLKTEAIDMTRPFLWFDDNLMLSERDALERHGALANWIGVDLRRDPHQLARFVESFPDPMPLGTR